MSEASRCVVLSDFNIDNFNALLTNDNSKPEVKVISTRFGQIHQYILDSENDCWAESPGSAIVWTRPEIAAPSFGRLLQYETVERESIIREVDDYSELLLKLKDRVNVVFMPTWTLPATEHGMGILDMQSGVGFKHALMEMNLRLSRNFEDEKGFYLLDTDKWIQRNGLKSYNSKLWAMAKIPFTNQLFSSAVDDMKAAMRAVSGSAKKLIILDLDNTIWGGIVGDDGWENLRLGGHDPLGEAYAEFQKNLKAMTNRGILLAIVSKNTEEVALDAIRKNPEMVLNLDDFAGWRINWQDKAGNVAHLVSELNLGLQSVVFLDDNPVERARVRESLREVYVPELPDDPFLYSQFLRGLSCFDTVSLTGEDRERARMYVSEKKRSSLKNSMQSMGEWLKTLDMEVHAEPLHDGNLNRVVQLLNKTNQMNLRTRRMSESELLGWLEEENRKMVAFRVSDKFGDSGLTGILALESRGDEAYITDFILSCRVMGRKVEETMVSVAADLSREMGAETLKAEYLQTEKNKPCLDFWNQSGFENGESEHMFRWNVSREYPLPDHIKLTSDL